MTTTAGYLFVYVCFAFLYFNSVDLFEFEPSGDQDVEFGKLILNIQEISFDENNKLGLRLVNITNVTGELTIKLTLGMDDAFNYTVEKNSDKVFTIVLHSSIDYEQYDCNEFALAIYEDHKTYDTYYLQIDINDVKE